MSRMTVCLLNWRRPQNVAQIVESLKKQTKRPRIFLWDNAPTPFCHPIGDIDWYVHSEENKRCWPRWWMASMADSDYVMSLDDDLVLADNTVIADLVDTLDKVPDSQANRIVGLEGVALDKGVSYSQALSSPVPAADRSGRPVDIIKGRLMAFRRSFLGRSVFLYQNVTEDDIALSGMLAMYQKRPHRVLPFLRSATKELSSPHALCEQPGHFKRRDQAAHDFFPWYRRAA